MNFRPGKRDRRRDFGTGDLPAVPAWRACCLFLIVGLTRDSSTVIRWQVGQQVHLSSEPSQERREGLPAPIPTSRGSRQGISPRASIGARPALTRNQAKKKPIRTTCHANGVLGFLARCQALLRERRGSALALQVQLQGHTRLESGQDLTCLPQPREEGSFFAYRFTTAFPCPHVCPILVLYCGHQTGSWFSSYSFSFSFSKLLALAIT